MRFDRAYGRLAAPGRVREGDSLLCLADEILLYIFSFLEPLELIAASGTSRHMYAVLQDEALWRMQYCRFWRGPRLGVTHNWKLAVVHAMKAEKNWDVGLHRVLALPSYLPGPVGRMALVGVMPPPQSSREVPGGGAVELRGSADVPTVPAAAGGLVRPSVGPTPLGGWHIVLASDLLGNVAAFGHGGACLFRQRAHSAEVNALGVLSPHDVLQRAEAGGQRDPTAYTAGAVRFVSCGGDALAKVWAVGETAPLATLAHHRASVESVVCAEGRLFTGSADETIGVWDPVTAQLRGVLHGHTGAVTHLRVADPAGAYVLSGALDNSLRVWDVRQEQAAAQLPLGAPPIDLDVQGVRAVCCTRTAMHVFDMRTRRALYSHMLTRPSHRASCMSFYAPDRLVLGTVSGNLLIFDMAAPTHCECVAVFSSPAPQYVASVSCDSRRIVSLGRRGSVRVFDIEDGFLYSIPASGPPTSTLVGDCSMVLGTEKGSLSFISFVR